MKSAVPIREKHDGSLGGKPSVRVWLRLLSCTMAIEKEVQRRFAERGMTLPRFEILAEKLPGQLNASRRILHNLHAFQA